MSENMEGQPIINARDKAIQYIQERDAQRTKRIRLGGIRNGVAPEEVEIAAATAYEKVIDKLGDNGVRRALEEMRPVAYDAARIYRYAAKNADMFVTGALLFAPAVIPALDARLNRVSGLTDARAARAASVAATPRTGRWLGALPIREDYGVVGAHARKAGLLGAGVVGMVKFRPIEWAATTAAKVGGVVTSEYAGMVNKVVDKIIGVKQPEKAVV